MVCASAVTAGKEEGATAGSDYARAARVTRPPSVRANLAVSPGEVSIQHDCAFMVHFTIIPGNNEDGSLETNVVFPHF